MPAIENAPPDRPDLALVMHCYVDASSERTVNGVIPFSAVATWCAVHAVDVGDVWEVIRFADGEVRRWQSSNSKK